jgi:hypothetical protein
VPLRCLYLLTALLSFVLVPGLARAGGGDQTTIQVVDGYTVVLSLPPNHVQTGPNDVTVTIHMYDGPAITSAVGKGTTVRVRVPLATSRENPS